jgi:mRNA deadenylase 3'-5' endonuclease subunit Ccr4
MEQDILKKTVFNRWNGNKWQYCCVAKVINFHQSFGFEQINEIKKIYNFIKPYAIGSVYHKLIPSKIKFWSNHFRRKLDTCFTFCQ